MYIGLKMFDSVFCYYATMYFELSYHGREYCRYTFLFYLCDWTSIQGDQGDIGLFLKNIGIGLKYTRMIFFKF